MNVFNYKNLAFSYFQDGQGNDGSAFHLLCANYLDYNHQIRSITVKHQTLGRKNVWLAEFSGVTTEYTGSMAEVLKKAHAHYESNSIDSHEEASNE